VRGPAHIYNLVSREADWRAPRIADDTCVQPGYWQAVAEFVAALRKPGEGAVGVAEDDEDEKPL
jgi:hypothetical protein